MNIFDRLDLIISAGTDAGFNMAESLDQNSGAINLPVIIVEAERSTGIAFSGTKTVKQEHHYTITALVSAQNAKLKDAKRAALTLCNAFIAALQASAPLKVSFEIREKSYVDGTLGSQKAAGTETELVVYDTTD